MNDAAPLPSSGGTFYRREDGSLMTEAEFLAESAPVPDEAPADTDPPAKGRKPVKES